MDLSAEVDSDTESNASEAASTTSDVPSLSTSDTSVDSIVERAAERFADALCDDPELNSLYWDSVAKFGSERFASIHDGLLKKYMMELRIQASTVVEVQAVRVLRHRTQRMELTKLIYMTHCHPSHTLDNQEAPMRPKEDASHALLQTDHSQSDVEASSEEDSSEDENDGGDAEELQNFDHAIKFLTKNSSYDQYKTRLYCLVHGPKNIPQALKYGKRKALRRLLENNFDAVARGDYEWLQELSDIGYSEDDMARLLLEEARDAPWIYFDPQEEKEPTPGSYLSPYNLQDSGQPSLKKTLETKCGLGGIVPWKPQKLDGHVSFRDDYCTASISYADSQRTKATSRSTLLSRVKRVLSDFLMAAEHLDSADFGSHHFTVVLKPPPASADYEGANSAELIRIDLNEVVALHRKLDVSKFSETVGKSELSQSYDSVKNILRPLFQGEPQFPADPDADFILHLCCLAAQFLCVGLLSFHQAHIGPLMPFFINRPQKQLILRGSHTSGYKGYWCIMAELTNLTCLGDIIGKPVLSFQLIREWPEDEEYPDPMAIRQQHDLTTTVDDLLLTWGPGEIVGCEGEEEHLLAIKIGGGVVHLEDGADPRLHWIPGSASHITSPQPFHRYRKITIGAQITERSDCPNDEGACRYRTHVKLLGTYKPRWTVKQRQLVAQVGQDNFSFQGGQIWEKTPGRTVKQHQLDPADTIDLLACLENDWGVQMSYCTGIARRVRLRKLVADLLPVFAQRDPHVRDWSTWNAQYRITTALASDTSLHDWLSGFLEARPNEGKNLLNLIGRILHALKPTGFSTDLERFVAAWPWEDQLDWGIHITCEKEKNIWTQLLNDSECSAVFAYISCQCLVYDHARETIQCKKRPADWTGTTPTVLQTAVSPYRDDQYPLNEDWRPESGTSYHIRSLESYILLKVENGSEHDQEVRLIASKSKFPGHYQLRHFWAKHWKRQDKDFLIQERQHRKHFGVEVIVSCLAE